MDAARRTDADAAAGPTPFRIDVSNAVLDDLYRRLENSRLPPAVPDPGWDLGMSPRSLRELLDYWVKDFDWRSQERSLNDFRQFTATVDGTRLHFIHEPGRGPAPLPILLTHGFPDSFYRFHELIPRLVDPASQGGDAADAFDVVVPSLPGYGFSEPRTAHGGLFGFGDLLHALMRDVLGYERFGAHGGDWGSTITEQIGRSHAASVAGIHLTDVPFWHALRKPKQATAAEKKYLTQIDDFQKTNGAYAMIQATRPQTLEVGLLDSPAGLAAWIVEKFREWSDCGGDLERCYTKDELLTNVTIYWATRTIGTSFQPYADVMSAGAVRWMKEAARNLIGSKSPGGLRDVPEGSVVAAPRVGRALLPRRAVDGDAARRPFRGDGAARSPGRGHSDVLPGVAALNAGRRGGNSPRAPQPARCDAVRLCSEGDVAMRTLVFLSAFCAIAGSPPLAQSSPAPPAGEGRYPCRAVHTFDFWVGDFDATPWNDPSAPARGRLHNTLEYEGCVIVERWEGASGSRGMSISFYDTNRRAWRMVWNGDDNRSNDFEGSYRDGAMRFEGWVLDADGKRLLASNVLQEVSPDTIRHIYSTSADGGKTWVVKSDGRFLRRKS